VRGDVAVHQLEELAVGALLLVGEVQPFAQAPADVRQQLG